MNGSSWGTDCAGWKSGTTWYRVTHVNGTAVASLYGVAALYAATGVLAAGAAPAPAPAEATLPPATGGLTTLGESVTFYGRGWGHGVGLSQYGARGRALAGQGAAEILAHYYPGTTIGALPEGADDPRPAPGQPRADRREPAHGLRPRRRLVDRRRRRALPARRPPSPGPDHDRHDHALARDRGRRRRGPLRRPRPGRPPRPGREPRRDAPAAGPLLHLRHVPRDPADHPLRRKGRRRQRAAPRVVPAGRRARWRCRPRGRLRRARRRRSRPARTRPSAFAPAPRPSTSTTTRAPRSTAASGAEAAAADAVIAETANHRPVQRHRHRQRASSTRPAAARPRTTRTSTSRRPGARVATPVSYLRGSSDRDANGVPYDATSPHATWQTNTYSLAQLSAIFAADSRTNVGTLVALDLRNRGVSGRLVSVTLVGSAGAKTVSGGVFIDGLQRAPAGRRPVRPEHAPRRRPDPLTAAAARHAPFAARAGWSVARRRLSRRSAGSERRCLRELLLGHELDPGRELAVDDDRPDAVAQVVAARPVGDPGAP